jgi:hypothetical protein
MIRKALLEYPNYSHKSPMKMLDSIEEQEQYERFIPETSSRIHVALEQKMNTNLGS